MLIRRYYDKNKEYNYTVSDEYFERLVKEHGLDYAVNYDTAEYDIIFENEKEYFDYLNESYERVKKNIKYYLDNLKGIPTFTRKFPTDKETYFTLFGEKMQGKMVEKG